MKKRILIWSGIGILFISTFALLSPKPREVDTTTITRTREPSPAVVVPAALKGETIQYLREREYPGSDIKIEKELVSSGNYKLYYVSYTSQGNTIFAVMTVPNGTKPVGGWPAIVLNHGYRRPKDYNSGKAYELIELHSLANSGYGVFMSDYHGHGYSQGKAEDNYYGASTEIDVLDAVASLKKYKEVDPSKIGMMGHSAGGFLTLKAMVISQDISKDSCCAIKAGVIWAGAVGSYKDLYEYWNNYSGPLKAYFPESTSVTGDKSIGNPDTNPKLFEYLSPTSYLVDISGPLQLHQGLKDELITTTALSEKVKAGLEAQGKTVEYYTYSEGDHLLSGSSFDPAIKRTIAFFDKYVK